jgi:hypothetical protein
MAEIENENFNKGHNLDLKQVRLDIYRLLCYFEASKPIATLSDTNSDFLMQGLFDEFMSDEVSRILLECAIVLRMIDDESESDIEEKDPFNCGELEFDTEITKLSLREACNKIIHGLKINFDMEMIGEFQYISSKVYIYGYHRKKEWRASIDIIKFINYGTRLLTTRTMSEYMELEHIYHK